MKFGFRIFFVSESAALAVSGVGNPFLPFASEQIL